MWTTCCASGVVGRIIFSLAFISPAVHGALAAPLAVNGESLKTENVGQPLFWESNTELVVTPANSASDFGFLQGDGTYTLLTLSAPVIVLQNASFSDGYSTSFGGCLFLNRSATVVLNNVHFSHCSAARGGGAAFVLPEKSLSLSVSDSSFFYVSTVDVASTNLDSLSLLKGSGCALSAAFLGDGSGTQIHFSNVSVSQFSAMSTVSPDYAETAVATGGAFSFAFFSKDSGHAINASFIDCSWQNGIATSESTVTCSNLSHCSTQSTLSFFVWFDSESGHDVSIYLSGISATNITSTASTPSKEALATYGIGFAWKGANSGDRFSVEVESGSFTEVSGTFSTSMIGAMWTMPGSGATARWSISGALTVASCSLGMFSSFLALAWDGDNSGANSVMSVLPGARVLFSDSHIVAASGSFIVMGWQGAGTSTGTDSSFVVAGQLSFVGCSVEQQGAFILLTWLSAESGSQSSLVSERGSLITIDDCALVGGESIFILLSWFGQSSGNSTSLQIWGNFEVSRSRLYMGSVLEMFWGSSFSGHNSSMAMADGSTVIINECQFLFQEGGIFIMVWSGKDAQGNNAALSIIGELSVINVELPFQGNIILAYWQGRESAQNFSCLLLPSSGFLCRNCRGSADTSILGILILESQAMALDVIVHGINFVCDVGTCAFPSGITLYMPVGLFGGKVAVSSVEVYRGSLGNFVQVISPFIVGMDLILTDWTLCNTSSHLIGINGTTASSSMNTQQQIVSVMVTNGQVYNGSVVDVIVATSSNDLAFMNMTNILANVSASESNLRGLVLTGFGTKDTIDAVISDVTLRSGALSLVQTSGIAGTVTVSRVHAAEPRFSAPVVQGDLSHPFSAISFQLMEVSIRDGHRIADVPIIQMTGSCGLSFLGPVWVDLRSVLDGTPIIYFENAGSNAFISAVNMSTPIVVVRKIDPSSYVGTLKLFDSLGGIPQLNNFLVTLHSFDPVGQIENVSYSVPSWQCPPGYYYEFASTWTNQFYLPYAYRPFNCLDPLNENKVICLHPYFEASFTCVSCPADTISFLSGDGAEAARTFVCQRCPPSLNCTAGPADAIILPGHWAPNLLEISDWGNFSLSDLVVRCPLGACQPIYPLSIENAVVVPGTDMCTAGRDPTSPLCSRCVGNSSASIFSSACYDCSWEWGQVLIIIIAIVAGSLFIVYLVRRPVTPQSPWFRMTTYYFSAVSIVYSSENSSSADIVLKIASVFTTFTPPQSSSLSEFFAVCIPGAGPLGMKVLKLAIPGALLFAFFVILLLRKITIRKRQATTSNQGARILSGLFSVILMSYSSTARVVFSFLPCEFVPVVNNNSVITREWRLFVDAEWGCWHLSSAGVVLAVVGLFFVFSVPVGLFMWQAMFPGAKRPLRSCVDHSQNRRRTKSKDETRWSNGSVGWSKRRTLWTGVTLLYVLEGNLRVWWWDSVLFVRRALLELVSVFVPLGVPQQLGLLSLNAAILTTHAIMRPYESSAANTIETVTLALLTVISAVNLPGALLETAAFSSQPFQSTLNILSIVQSWLAFGGFLILLVSIVLVYGSRGLRLLVAAYRRSRQKVWRLSSGLQSTGSANELQQTLLDVEDEHTSRSSS